MQTEIADILPATPPATAPVCELRRHISTGVSEFEKLLVEYDEEFEVGPVEEGLYGPDGPRIVPGPNSGLTKEEKCKRETVTRGR